MSSLAYELKELDYYVSQYEEDPSGDFGIDERIDRIRMDLSRGTQSEKEMFSQLKRKYVKLKRKQRHPDLMIELRPPDISILSYPQMDDDIDIISHGKKVTQSSLEKLRNTAVTSQRAKELGEMTTQQLAKQMEQIASMGEVLDTIDPELVRANRHIKRMTRSVCTNKLLWVLIFFILVAIGVLMYLKMT